MDLKARAGVVEAVILSTCNRVEITVTVEDGSEPDAIVAAFLADRKALGVESIEPHLYRHEGREAIHHLFRVAQVWIPWWSASRKFSDNSRRLMPRRRIPGSLLRLARRRADAGFRRGQARPFGDGIGQMAVSVSYAAVELARKIFGSLEGRTIMIVGAGKMSELAARHLRRSGATHVLRHQPDSRARRGNGEAVSGHARRVHAFPAHAARGRYRDHV